MRRSVVGGGGATATDDTMTMQRISGRSQLEACLDYCGATDEDDYNDDGDDD